LERQQTDKEPIHTTTSFCPSRRQEVRGDCVIGRGIRRKDVTGNDGQYKQDHQGLRKENKCEKDQGNAHISQRSLAHFTCVSEKTS